MTSEKQISLGKKTAWTSFLIGTIIFGLFFLTSNSQYLFIGYGFIAIAGLFNLVVLISLSSKANTDSENRSKLLLTSGLMLLNIPVLISYVWFALILIGNMRITFTNATGHHLTNINIIGCETKFIDELKPNESKTIWVGITGDCHINLEYVENGIIKTETVIGYVTSGMGQKMNHEIDGINKDML